MDKSRFELMLFQGCGPEAASECASLLQIWQRQRAVFQDYL